MVAPSVRRELEEERPGASVIEVTPEEGRRMFDEVSRKWVGMSGEEFIARYDAGEFKTIPDDLAHRRYIDLVLLIPFAR